MDNIAKKKFKKIYNKVFLLIKKNNFYKTLRKLHISLRIVILLICMAWFFISTILMPPIPLGNIVLILGLVIVFPIDKVKSKLHFIINRLRIKKIYAKRLSLKHRFFSKNK